jgi:stage II sporulation protein D
MRVALALAICGSALAAAAASASTSTMFFMRGGGDGHGIGMSQYGAYGYALHGKDYRFILAHYYRGTELGKANPRRVVRVLLATGGTPAFAGADTAGGKRLNPAVTYQARPLADGSISLIDQAGKQVGRFGGPLSVTGPGPLGLAGVGSYRGALELRPNGGGGVETVEAVALEDYVRGVISKEVPASWSMEALKVQAVAARTYAITTNRGGATFDQYADTRSQMYGGVGAETATTDAAVAATRGQIVTYHGSPAVTYFFNSSGGHTENVEVVWPGATPEPWLKGVPDPYDDAGGDPYHRWGSDMTAADAAAKLSGLYRGTFIGIRVVKHGASPRIIAADVVGTLGHSRVSGTQLQQMFGTLTTNMTFTTISSRLGQPKAVLSVAPRPSSLGGGGPVGAQAIAALMPLVRALSSGATPMVSGRVFPGRVGESIDLQVAGRRGAGGAGAGTGTGWRTVLRGFLGAGGQYAVQPSGPGVYRVVYRGLAGAAVRVR